MLVGHLTGIEPLGPLGEFATALGLTTVALLHLQFLSSGRYEHLSGRIGIDRTMGFHRLAAGTLLVFAILHPLGYATAGASGDPVMAWNRLLNLLVSARLRSGVFALAGLVVIVLLAVLRTRPWLRYEYWRASHGPLAVVLTALSVHHAVINGTYTGEIALRLVWVVLALMAGAAVLMAYVFRPLRMWREGWVIERVSRVGARTVEMILRGPVGTALRFRAGQFIWLSIAPNRPPFHDHPFSIASAPADLPGVRLVVGEVGNCTSHFAEIAPGTRVAVDGPHGSFILPPGDGPVLLVAGGVGIAPIFAILADAAARNDRRPFRLLYAARNRQSVVGVERLDALRARLELTICFLLDDGPLDVPHIRELLAGIQPDTAVAMLCGPPRMMEIAADALLDAGMRASAIHYERFDFGAGKGRLDHRRRRQALSVFAVLLVLMGLFSLRGS
jgi:predicted ferric reductase